jgi:hypothetical protein
MRHQIVKLGLPLLVALVAGCTTMGTGYGSAAAGASPVNFRWRSPDSVFGTMNPGPRWSEWYPGWGGRRLWDNSDAFPSRGFIPR